MSLRSITIKGFRGFSKSNTIYLAEPNKLPGSGLTVLTGPNNSGKSSILECINLRSSYESPSFDVEMRNRLSKEVLITYDLTKSIEFICSIKQDASESKFLNRNDSFKSLVLPSRRAFNPYFSKGIHTRDQHTATLASHSRTNSLSGFEYRLFKIAQNPNEFNKLLNRVLGFTPDWAIEKSGQGQYFLKLIKGEHSHNASGLGEGVISIFSIIDSLYDSKEGDLIGIDEPELSLHPSLQKRLADLIVEYSATRQIIVSTHSPYFIDFNSIKNNGEIYRISNVSGDTNVNRLSNESKKWIANVFGKNKNNPHIFGLDAKEIFFSEDKILITEGQDDVIFYPTVFEQVGIDIDASFYGWGIGGADNAIGIARILNDLGFEKVVALLDNNQENKLDNLRNKFPKFMFDCIPSEDIRTKKPRKATDQIDGLLDERLIIRPNLLPKAKIIIEKVNEYLTKSD